MNSTGATRMPCSESPDVSGGVFKTAMCEMQALIIDRSQYVCMTMDSILAYPSNGQTTELRSTEAHAVLTIVNWQVKGLHSCGR